MESDADIPAKTDPGIFRQTVSRAFSLAFSENLISHNTLAIAPRSHSFPASLASLTPIPRPASEKTP